MEGYSMVKKLGNIKGFKNSSMKFLSIYILIFGLAMSLSLVYFLGSIVGFGAGLNTLVLSAVSWIADSAVMS